MATVNKNFRIKNGLIVEGATATVNGFGVLTKAQADQDYIVSLIGGTATSANTVNTVVKRDANGNFAAGTITATFVGNLTGDVTGTVSSLSNHDTADLAEGTNLYFTNARALSATSSAYDAAGSAAAAQSAAITAAGTDATTKVAAEAALRVSGDAASVSTASADATSKANAAQAAAISAAATDATTKSNAAQAAAISAAATDATSKANAAQAAAISAAATDATSKANAAQAAAEATAAGALSTAISTEVSNRNTAISTAVDNLVDGAPALLNTLNELAAAINDDANYTTTITTALGTKAPLASPTFTGTVSGITSAMVGLGNVDNTSDANKPVSTATQAALDAKLASATAATTYETITNVALKAPLASPALTGVPTAPTAAAGTDTTQVATTAFVKAAADAAQAAATSAANALTTDDVAEGTSQYFTDARARTAVDGTTRSFTAVELNSVAKQVAATTGNIAVAAETTAISWVAADYRSAKFIVKVKNGVHTQVSDLVVTLDTANNVGVSEYGITYSNGTELAAVTADYSGSDVRIRVTPANANTEVIVVGTLIK
jgi:hypothetical protein